MNSANRHLRWLLVFVCLLLVAEAVTAQPWSRGGGGRSRYGDGRGGVPEWDVSPVFKHDTFTFVRIIYSSKSSGRGRGYGRGGGCWTDYPDSDLNFSFRLQQLTAMKVAPEGVQLELSDPRLFDYPFIYLIEPGRLLFREAEVQALRRYLLGGGFLMVDDFWGEDEWDNFYQEIKRVFPDREPEDITMAHPIFNTVFPLNEVLDEMPQIPSIRQAQRGRNEGRTWERSDARDPYYRVVTNDKGRVMVIICHNTDLGDGWEREGEDEWYFREFSEKKAYPLGINIVFYAMTH
jgi:hypothetical protein